jgi:hypothetical protein
VTARAATAANRADVMSGSRKRSASVERTPNEVEPFPSVGSVRKRRNSRIPLSRVVRAWALTCAETASSRAVAIVSSPSVDQPQYRRRCQRP